MVKESNGRIFNFCKKILQKFFKMAANMTAKSHQKLYLSS